MTLRQLLNLLRQDYSMNIVHIIPDSLFWESVLAVFEQSSEHNTYYGVPENDSTQFKYIHSDNVTILPSACVNKLCKEGIFDTIMFHSLPGKYYDAIRLIPQGKIVIVSSWGYDIYYNQNGCSPIIQINLFKPITGQYINPSQLSICFTTKIKRTIKKIINYKGYYSIYKQNKKEHNRCQLIREKAISRVDYWATVLPIEYEMLNALPYFSAKYFPFKYARSDNYAVPLVNHQIAKCILLGNSADPSNNHIDVINVIKDRGIINKLLIPISYGGDDYYRTILEQYILENNINCELLKDILPYLEYAEKLMSCNCAIFGHMRQQAVGNIQLSLKQGRKVFMYKDSVCYKHFKSEGYIVFSIEDDLTIEEITKPLPTEDIQKNIRLQASLSLHNISKKVNNSLLSMHR